MNCRPGGVNIAHESQLEGLGEIGAQSKLNTGGKMDCGGLTGVIDAYESIQERIEGSRAEGENVQGRRYSTRIKEKLLGVLDYINNIGETLKSLPDAFYRILGGD